MNKEILIAQFSACYDENGWFVAVRNAIEGVTAEQAIWKPAGADNSIWEIISHLNYYNNAYLQRFKGVDYQYDKADNDATFEAADSGAEADWNAAVGRFDAIMTGWRTLLEAADGARFDEPVSEKNQSKWAEVILNINAHTAYHGGQILLLRKLQGSWNPEKGVS